MKDIIKDSYLINFQCYKELGDVFMALRVFDKVTKKVTISSVFRPEEFIDSPIGALPLVSLKNFMDVLNSVIMGLDKENPFYVVLSRFRDGSIVGIEKELGVEEPDPINPVLLRQIEDFEFRVRTTNCLKSMGIFFIGELVQLTEIELMSQPNMGQKSLREIQAILKANSLSLGVKIENWVRPERKLRGE